MDKVFVLQHVHPFDDGEEDVKLIGVFSVRSRAEEAIAYLLLQPGFKEHPDGFHLEEFCLDEYFWKEGYVTIT
jgi:hypothetical protein